MRRPQSPSAFSLVELLVCIAVIAVLLALAIPALAKARARAQGTACAASIREGGSTIHQFADQANRGRYPNALEPDTIVAEWTLGSTTIVTDKNLDQTRMWTGALAAFNWVPRYLDGSGFGCPVAARQLGADAISANPQLLQQYSFWYSAALYTRSELWDPAFPSRRTAPDQWRQTVGMHSVTFPSKKVALFEVADYHGKGKTLQDLGAGVGKVNVAFCDGHVLAVDPGASAQPLSVPWPNYPGGAIPFTGAMPFSAAASGFAGRDF